MNLVTRHQHRGVTIVQVCILHLVDPFLFLFLFLFAFPFSSTLLVQPPNLSLTKHIPPHRRTSGEENTDISLCSLSLHHTSTHLCLLRILRLPLAIGGVSGPEGLGAGEAVAGGEEVALEGFLRAFFFFSCAFFFCTCACAFALIFFPDLSG